jgi:hypothetical protein
LWIGAWEATKDYLPLEGSRLRRRRSDHQMQMRQIRSSTIARVGYDESSRELVVEFVNGTTYKYLDVPPTMYEALTCAMSAGRFFGDHIRDEYRFVRL